MCYNITIMNSSYFHESSLSLKLIKHKLILLVLFAVLGQLTFHEAEVHYHVEESASHHCIFCHAEADPKPTTLTLTPSYSYLVHLNSDNKIEFSGIAQAFLLPLWRAPPL